jgi:cytochrome c-type biogenesis protein CcmH/NrfF
MMAWEGATSDSIVNWMLASYGDQYRGVPLARGGGLWAWLMPPLALLAGFIVVGGALRRFRKRREMAPPPAAPLSEDDETMLAAALEELKASEEVPF